MIKLGDANSRQGQEVTAAAIKCPLLTYGLTPAMSNCGSGCGSDQARGSGWRVGGASRVQCLWSPPL